MKVTNYLGLDDIKYCFINQWADPELYYQGKIYNAAELESNLYSDFYEYVQETGISENYENYEKWLIDNKYLVYEWLDCLCGITPLDKLPKKLYTHEAILEAYEYYKNENWKLYESNDIYCQGNYNAVIVDPSDKYKNMCITRYYYKDKTGENMAYQVKKYSKIPKKFQSIIDFYNQFQ